MICVLEVLSKSASSGFRDYGGAVHGDCAEKPTVGHSFRMSATPLDPSALVRMIETTPVVSLRRDGKSIVFKTESGSTYRFTEEFYFK